MKSTNVQDASVDLCGASILSMSLPYLVPTASQQKSLLTISTPLFFLSQ